MTDKKFRFLEQLEDDLRDAAARERVAKEGTGAPKRVRRGGSGQRWPRMVAASVAVLVLAGAVGAFVQHNSSPNSSTAEGLGAGRFMGIDGTSGSGGAQAVDTSKVTHDSVGKTTGVNGALVPAAAPATAPVPTHQLNQANSYATNITTVPQQDISKIIRNGLITVELPTGGFSAARDRVNQYATGADGYVVSSSARGSGSGTFVLRIRARKFDVVMGQLAHLPGGNVLWQTSSGQDVTAQFIDSNAQLQILKSEKAATLRYLKNAGSLSQAIQFRNQAFQIQGEIDKLQGQLNYLSDQVALSTITVNLREKGAPASVRNQAPVTKPSLVRAWDRAVSGFLGVLSAVIVGLGFLIPIGILALLIGLPLMAMTRKRRAASSAS